METISAWSGTDATNTPQDVIHPSIEHPLPRTLGACVLIRDFLSRTECHSLIAQAESRGFASAELDYPPSYRNNDRQVLDDRALANRLLQRLKGFFRDGKHSLLPAEQDDEWQLQGINERLRLCKYRENQQFRVHQDGVHHRGPDYRSMLTFMVYLTDGSEFDGGDTLFYAAGPSQGESERQVIARVRPAAGSLILFDHGIWHAGAVVTRGTKYILRSDLLFRRSGHAATQGAPTHHQGYIWTLAALGDGRLASGGRDGRIRLWHPGGQTAGVLHGHEQSVLGLVESGAGTLASISRDRALRFWDTSAGRCLRSVAAHDAAALSITRLSGGWLATGGADHAIHLWSAHGKRMRTLSGHDGWVWGLSPLANGLLASVSEDQTLRLWQANHGECTDTLRVTHPLRTIDADHAMEANSTQRIAVGDTSGRVTLWLLHQGKATEWMSFTAHDAAVRRVRFLRDRTLATCGEDNRLRIWNLTPLRMTHEDVRTNFVTDVIEAGNGTRVSCGYDGKLVWS